MEIFCQFALYFYLLNTLFMYCLSAKDFFIEIFVSAFESLRFLFWNLLARPREVVFLITGRKKCLVGGTYSFLATVWKI